MLSIEETQVYQTGGWAGELLRKFKATLQVSYIKTDEDGFTKQQCVTQDIFLRN